MPLGFYKLFNYIEISITFVYRLVNVEVEPVRNVYISYIAVIFYLKMMNLFVK